MIMTKLVELALVGVIASVFLVVVQGADETITDEAAGKEYMEQLNELMGVSYNKWFIDSWNYESNITDYNEEIMLASSLKLAETQKQKWAETDAYAWNDFEDANLKRMFQKYSVLGNAALPEDQYQSLMQAITNMTSNYAKATICSYQNSTKCDLTVEPGVTDIFANSEDPAELKYAWVEWHRAAGAINKGNFTEYVNLTNEAAKLNGFDNAAEWWLSEYEEADTEDQFMSLWNQIRPLYLQFHAYVRRLLRLKYGDDIVSEKGPIPAHLLGNIWAQIWTEIEKFTKPFPDKPEVDITKGLVAQNYTVLKMFQMSDEFFQSINMTAMPDTFWNNSIIEKPDDGRDIICHPSAWDFFDGKDFRIKQCSSLTSSFFITTHHEMGHIQYYIHYSDQPEIFKGSANPGFQEAVGDTIALSVATPKHLRVVGLLEEGEDDEETEINQLYKMGLDRIVFLPFGYLLDLFRYGVFRGTTTPEDYNCHFWALREALQGVEPPVARSDEQDFDPAAKYHISADVEYARYYISYIIQFQFQQALCELAGEYGGDSNATLASCDIYRSAAAGNALSNMLKLGTSKPWPDAMEALTGQRNMNASGVLEYFDPLYQWLKAENTKNGEYIGWEPSTVEYCTESQKARRQSSGFDDNLAKVSGTS